MASAARIVPAAELFVGRPIGMRGAVVACCRIVVLRTGVRVGKFDGERCAGRPAPIDARYELRNIRFAAGRSARRAAAASGKVGCEIFCRKGDSRGYAVEHDADLRAVRFAPQGDAEACAESVHVRSFSNSSKKVG